MGGVGGGGIQSARQVPISFVGSNISHIWLILQSNDGYYLFFYFILSYLHLLK